jgi:hypothetical protein
LWILQTGSGNTITLRSHACTKRNLTKRILLLGKSGYPVTKRTCCHFVEKLHLSAPEPLGINPDEQFLNRAKTEVDKHPIKSKLDMETLILSIMLSIQQKIELVKKLFSITLYLYEEKYI